MKSKTEVNSVSETHRKSGRCFRCGKEGHFARDQSCPARKATCNNYHNQGHFATMCKKKKTRESRSLNLEKAASVEKMQAANRDFTTYMVQRIIRIKDYQTKIDVDPNVRFQWHRAPCVFLSA